MFKIISKKEYEELKEYKDNYKEVVEKNTDLKLDLGDARTNIEIYEEQVKYLQNELKKYKPEKKKAGRPKKVEVKEEKPTAKRKVGRPRKESK